MLALLRTTHNYRGFSFKAKVRTVKGRKPTSTVHPLLQAVQAVDDSGFVFWSAPLGSKFDSPVRLPIASSV
jgi:hypothetical protein